MPLSVQKIASDCDIRPPISIKNDILGHGNTRIFSVREKLIAMQAECTPWEVVAISKDMAVHAALLPLKYGGQILYFGGYRVDDTHLYSVASDTITDISTEYSPKYNIFCAGHAFLADGRLLVAGGQLHLYNSEDNEILPPETEQLNITPHAKHGGMRWGGERRSSIYDPFLDGWQEIQPLSLDPAGNPNSGGRWYPTLCTLADGDVLTVGGHPDLRELYADESGFRHSNNTPERFNPNSGDWTLLASHPPNVNQTTEFGSDERYDYHRNHLLPNGQVFFTSPVRNANRIYDPFVNAFISPPIIDLPSDAAHRVKLTAQFTSVLLPLLAQNRYRPKALLMGGNKPERIDLSNLDSRPKWHQAGNRDWGGTPPKRIFSCPVILPTGQIFFSGGARKTGDDEVMQANPVLHGEIYTPGIDWQTGEDEGDNESWETVESAHIPRHYHSTALLMPNGTIWTAGSNGPVDPDSDTPSREKRIEIYRPHYLRELNRSKIIEAPTSLIYGQNFTIRTTQAHKIQRVALLRNGSVTHGFNPDQRYIALSFQHTEGDQLQVIAPPWGGVAPPGYYMLWVIDEKGHPCQLAKFIQISALSVRIIAKDCDISTPISLANDILKDKGTSLKRRLIEIQRDCFNNDI